MSGYRSLHREKVGDYPIWQVATSPVLTKNTHHSKAPLSWRIWTACGDGVVRGFLVQEKSLESQKDVLDASACTCTCTHVLVGDSQQEEASSSPPSSSSSSSSSIGCSQVRLARNYVGDDDMAGDLLVVSMDLSGRIRIWSLAEDMDDELLSASASASASASTSDSGTTTPATAATAEANPQHIITASHEMVISNATGTCLQICPPKISGVGDVLLAVARLDGTVAVVASGLATSNNVKASVAEPSPAGTIVDVWSKPGSIAMSGAWHPTKKSLVVGRQDGLVEILGERPHRLIHHEAPVRAVAFTPDANLLITASDDGMLAVWDLGRVVPILVHHVVQSHASWVLSTTALSDSRRFLTCGADRKLHVWSAGQMHQSLHTFTCDDTVWTIQATTAMQRSTTNGPPAPQRLVTGSEDGGIQIYSLEA